MGGRRSPRTWTMNFVRSRKAPPPSSRSCSPMTAAARCFSCRPPSRRTPNSSSVWRAVMPIKPGKDESQSDWMGRCVPEMMGDGKREQDQAVAACLSIWREKDKGAAKLDARVKQVDPPDDDEAEEEFIDRCVEQITQDEDIDEDEAEDRCRLMWDERAMRLRPRNGKGGKQAPAIDPPRANEAFPAFMERCVAGLVHGGEDQQRAEEHCSLVFEESTVPGSGLRSRSANGLIHKTHAEVLATATGKEFVLSDETPDRIGDIIMADGWDFSHFKNNPIALFNHDPGFPIGKWADLRVEDKKLRSRLLLAP